MSYSNSTSPSIPTLTPQPPLFPPIPDAWVLLALPIIAYWSLSLFFHYLDTHDILSRYRLHTPAEVLKRNHVTRYEVVRDVILQQIIQTVMGGATAMFEGVKMVGGESAEIDALYATAIRWLPAAVDGRSIIAAVGAEAPLLRAAAALGLESPDLGRATVEFAYWYIAPVLRLGVAIFVMDTWQYFLHRAMHEIKWLYSLPPLSDPTRIAEG